MKEGAGSEGQRVKEYPMSSKHGDISRAFLSYTRARNVMVALSVECLQSECARLVVISHQNE